MNAAPQHIDPRIALRVALAAECDPRTAERALREGVDVVRPRMLRERLRVAIAAVDGLRGCSR